jgi:hypothetical protein
VTRIAVNSGSLVTGTSKRPNAITRTTADYRFRSLIWKPPPHFGLTPFFYDLAISSYNNPIDVSHYGNTF